MNRSDSPAKNFRAAATQETEEATGTRGRERASYDGDTAIKLYLREIGQVKLLTPQEEIDLAARIKKGDKKAGTLHRPLFLSKFHSSFFDVLHCVVVLLA